MPKPELLKRFTPNPKPQALLTPYSGKDVAEAPAAAEDLEVEVASANSGLWVFGLRGLKCGSRKVPTECTCWSEVAPAAMLSEQQKLQIAELVAARPEGAERQSSQSHVEQNSAGRVQCVWRKASCMQVGRNAKMRESSEGSHSRKCLLLLRTCLSSSGHQL